MQLIISSYILNDKTFFSKININHKFLTIFDLIKKIKKNYLNESKIIFLYNDSDNIDIIINLIKNYSKYLQLFLINKNSFFINKSSLFFFKEFISQKNDLKNLDLIFKNNNNFSFPKIIINNIFNLNVIITGVCRNISQFIFNSFHKFVYLTLYFKNTKIIIYENDSTDDTLEQLNKFKNIFNNIEIIILSEKNITGTLTQRISHARNSILNYISTKNLKPDYIINIDMDDILLEFKCDSILQPFKDNLNWSMVGGNSEIYYDMWALRTLNNPYKDFWDGKKLDNKYIIPINTILESYFKIDKESSPIKVHSCFNGIGIYKYNHIIECFYNGDNTCEHIHFHQNMIDKHNANLYIYPKLIVGPHKILGKPMDKCNILKLVKNKL